MGNNLKLTAKEAYTLTQQSTFIENVIYKNIKQEAEHGRSMFIYNYDCENESSIVNVVKKLKEDGYKVVQDTEPDENHPDLVFGTLYISWNL